MKIKYATFIMTLLITILAFSALPGYIQPVKASEASGNWHSTNGWPTAWNEYWPDECDVSEDVVYYIFQKFNSLNYEWRMWSSGEYTTANSILSVADSMDTYNYAAVFIYSHGTYFDKNGYYYIGDDIWVPVSVEHFRSFMQPTNESYDDLFDFDLGSTNGCGGHHFVFQWTCASAKIQGYWDYTEWIYVPEYGYVWYEGTGAVGWAYSWTTVYGLSGDGYGSPDETAYAFIGFADYSPPLTDSTGYSDKTYADFITAFYDKALDTNNRATINLALDYAAQQTCGAEYYFSETTLYNGWTAYVPPPANQSRETSMRVFGNGNNYLSIG